MSKAFTAPTPPPGCAPFRYPSDPLQFITWRDFVSWAISEPAMRAAFETVAKRRFLTPPHNCLEAAIDIATGARGREGETVVAFIEWLNVSHWGDDMVSWQPLPAVMGATHV